MQTTNTTPSHGLDPVKDEWDFLEVWLDPLQSPPYVLLLLSDPSGMCFIFDPADRYRMIKACAGYDEAQLWLLEDEYEPLQERLLGVDIRGFGHHETS